MHFTGQQVRLPDAKLRRAEGELQPFVQLHEPLVGLALKGDVAVEAK